MANSDALNALRSFIARTPLDIGGRLPPERSLSAQLGVSRPALRGALAVLEAEGVLWRHVGQGTFYGSKPPPRDKSMSLLARRTHPDEVMEARLVIEPQLAALAARRATLEDVHEIDRCLKKSTAGVDFQTFELWDSALHEAIARAARNTLLLDLFKALNSIRERRVWGKLKTASLTPDRLRHYHQEHTAFVAAIRERDAGAAERAMRMHLTTVRTNLFQPESQAGQPATR